jgi:hypothetical protein
VTAALEVVAKQKANAAPRTIVRIMDRSLFKVKPRMRPHADFQNQHGARLSSNMTKTMTDNFGEQFFGEGWIVGAPQKKRWLPPQAAHSVDARQCLLIWVRPGSVGVLESSLLYPGGLNRSTQHFILKERWSVV